jgi:hypothetical protein
MSNVISLAAAKEERQPHWAGSCHCLECKHEWAGVGPVGTVAHLECPQCHLPKGVVRNLFGPDEGDHALVCTDCGNDTFTIYKRKKDLLKVVACLACGLDCTDGFFDG